jgi:SNF2 family DNA or RNA helicase
VSLSGTPIENRLDELWSQLHFTNPGLLGGARTSATAGPRRSRDGDSRDRGAAARADPAVRLRRLKREVAPELPPRTEACCGCELDEDERMTYDAVRAATQKRRGRRSSRPAAA